VGGAFELLWNKAFTFPNIDGIAFWFYHQGIVACSNTKYWFYQSWHYLWVFVYQQSNWCWHCKDKKKDIWKERKKSKLYLYNQYSMASAIKLYMCSTT